MSIIRLLNADAWGRPKHAVTIRTSLDWQADVAGKYGDKAWTFDLDPEVFAGADEFKFVLDGAHWQWGFNNPLDFRVAELDFDARDTAFGAPPPSGDGAGAVADANIAATQVEAVAGNDPAPPPLMVFDPNGPASIIDYQLPETMSYRGRHILDLGFEGSDFADLLNASNGNAAIASAVSVVSGDAVSTATSGAATTDPRSVVAAPPAVVLSDLPTDAATAATTPVVQIAPFDLTPRLANLKWSDVAQITANGKRVDIYRSLGGPLDFRVRRQPGPVAPAAVASSAGVASSALRADDVSRFARTTWPGTPGGGPELSITITSPDRANPQLTGPAAGYVLTVSGNVVWSQTGTPSVSVQVDGQAAVTATLNGQQFSAQVTINTAGAHTIKAAAEAATLSDSDSVTVNVTLDGPGQGAAPSLSIDSPSASSIVVSNSSTVVVTVTGTANGNGGAAPTLTLTATDSKTGPVNPTLKADGTWSENVELDGYGSHIITVSAANSGGSLAQSILVDVEATQPAHPIDRRLFLVEEVAVSSFLGDCGVGKLIKTFTLLPGEQTTISVETYLKDETTSKAASSILDSTASECSSDFEDTINEEQDRKAANASSQSLTIAASAGGTWGFGSAHLSSSYGTTANSSREEMSKDVRNALQKHAMKASSNRTVTVNTEFTDAYEQTTSNSTQRTLKNINVSRVLNFVFRQMVQEHAAVIHLVDAKIGYYTQDLLLNADGTPGSTQETYSEYSFPEFGELATQVLSGGAAAAAKAEDKLLQLLSAVPNASGELKPLIEMFTPTLNGTPQTNAGYLRVIPNLIDSVSTEDGRTFPVPGIALSLDTLVMRTDGILVDAVLGEGTALDDYSASLQNVTIAERQVSVARQQIAIDVARAKDPAWASVYAAVFWPPAAAMPALELVQAPTPAANGGASNQ